MLNERIGRLKEWVKYELDWNREARKFHEFFPYFERPNGVLCKPGEEISPVLRGFITAKGSFRIMSKTLKGKELTDDERRRVREAAWLESHSGTYQFYPSSGNGVEVKISLDNDEAARYLAENTPGAVMGFLMFRDNRSHYRYKESSDVRVEEETDQYGFRFTFAEVTEIPTSGTELYIYTRPQDDEKIDPRFIRLGLMLDLPDED